MRMLRQHAMASPQLQLTLTVEQQGDESVPRLNSRGFNAQVLDVAIALCRREGTFTRDELRAACIAQGIKRGQCDGWFVALSAAQPPFVRTGQWRKQQEALRLP